MSNTKIEKELALIKQLLLMNNNSVIVVGGYINKKNLLKFLDYSDSSLRRLEENGLEFLVLKNRKFYKIDDVISFLEKHRKHQ